MKKKYPTLIEGPVLNQLLSLTWPSIGGFLSMIIFNMTDTYFVSLMGTEALAAMGFTFPVVMVIGSASTGISMGAASVISRAMGQGDHYHMKRTATDGVLLSVLFVTIVSAAGLLTMDPLFRFLGAEGESLKLVKDYMFIWYIGAVTVTMPAISDSCLRAVGDMMRPFIVMTVCALLNVVLDPILIFGYFGVPAMGIRGAALATLISRFAGMVTTLSFLHFHAGLVDFSIPKFREVRESWSRILHVGIPATMTQLLLPLSRSFLTKMAAASGGTVAVAAMAAGSRIEGFIQMLIVAYSLALIPMVGQNWGAGRMDRILSIRRISLRFALVYGALVFVVFLFIAEPVARLFSSETMVVKGTAYYLKLMALSAAGLGYMTFMNQSLNSAGKPYASARLNLITYIVILLPLAWVGSTLWDFKGIVIALALTQVLGALWAHGEAMYVFRHPRVPPAVEEKA